MNRLKVSPTVYGLIAIRTAIHREDKKCKQAASNFYHFILAILTRRMTSRLEVLL